MPRWSVDLRGLQRLRPGGVQQNRYVRQDTDVFHRGETVTRSDRSDSLGCLQRQSKHDLRDDELVGRGGVGGLREAAASEIGSGLW